MGIYLIISISLPKMVIKIHPPRPAVGRPPVVGAHAAFPDAAEPRP